MIRQIISSIRSNPKCAIKPASGLPDVGSRVLPQDVLDFYSECGGVDFFPDSDHGIAIVSPREFEKANPVIAGVEGSDDLSADWFIIAKRGEQYVTIDLNSLRLGKCYDSFWDRHAVAGSCPIIAKSFTELLQRLLASNGEQLFWLTSDFVSYGDAYGEC